MRKVLIIVLVLSLIFSLSSCSKTAKADEVLPASSESLQPKQTEPLIPTEPPIQEPAKVIEKSICPLTGLPIAPEQVNLRPIAVMIDNMASARPQSGLINAELVYEMPAEGGITRYLAIYHHQNTDKIGPVRSARSYFIDKAIEFNAIFIHAGGSPAALKDIQTLKVDSLNELKGERNFWRARDRKAPHNLYTSTKLTREVMDTKKLSNEKWSGNMNFSEDFLDLDGKATIGLVIDYKNNYKAGYEYDEKQKLYFRTINGVRVRDKETNAEVSTVNIIVEKVNARIVDDVGRLELSNIGSGRGYFITGGKLIEIEWKKDSRLGKTKYTDLKGNVITLNKGNIWIQVVPDYATIEIKG